jgi:hypothetical protein
MQLKSIRRLLGPAVVVLATACGGHTVDYFDGGPREDAAAAGGQGSGSLVASGGPSDQSPSSVPMGSSTPPGGSTPPASSGPSTGASPPITVTPGDGGCPAVSWQPGPAFSTCWDCMWRGCSTQLTACAADCACSQAVANAIACSNGGGPSFQCFGPGFGPTGNPPMPPLGICLSIASADCGCRTGPMAGTSSDASTCTPMGGGGGGGGGQCTFTGSEMCGGTSYQVVCACPQGNCACIGPSTKVIPFAGCPNCGSGLPLNPPSTMFADLFVQCGFPN